MKKIINYIRTAKASYYGYRNKQRLEWKSLPKDYRHKVNFYTIYIMVVNYLLIIIPIAFVLVLFTQILGG